MRIISVVPSLTELLFDLGLEDEIIGITRFCIHPKDQVKSIPKVGGTKTLKLARIDALKPDIIIANKEENSQSDIEYLQQKHPVLLTDIFTVEDALFSIKEIGQRTNKSLEANHLVKQITQEFSSIRSLPPKADKVAYLIWDNPVMVSGQHTFIHDILIQLGFVNFHPDPHSRYPVMTDAEINAFLPDLIFLSSEPFPFTHKHLANFKIRFPHSQIVLVDGEMFSWYGSRLLKAHQYFNRLITDLI